MGASLSTIKYKGVAYASLSALAKAQGVNRVTLNRRLAMGWSLKKAIKTPVGKPIGTTVIVGDLTFPTIRAAAEYFAIGYECAQRRLANGWTPEDTFEVSAERTSCSGIVYMIYNTINDKKYIGVTVQKRSYRFNGHKQDALKGGNSKLHRAMRKLGVENFRIRTLKSDKTPRQMWRLEKVFIKKYNTIESGYNEKFGGGSFGNQNGRQFTVGSETFKSLKEAAEHLGIKAVTLSMRLQRGFDPIDAVTRGRIGKSIKYKGTMYASRAELATHLGMSTAALCARIKRGQSLSDPVRPSTNPAGRKGMS